MSRNRVSLDLNTKLIKRALADDLNAAMFAGGEVIADAVRDKAPVDSGDLRRSIYVSTADRSTYERTAVSEKERRPDDGGAVVAAAAFYAHFIESGTVKKPASPFFRPAYDESRDKSVDAAAAHLRAALEREVP